MSYTWNFLGFFFPTNAVSYLFPRETKNSPFQASQFLPFFQSLAHCVRVKEMLQVTEGNKKCGNSKRATIHALAGFKINVLYYIDSY